MWQGTAIVGKWQICTSAIMHIKVVSMLHTLNVNIEQNRTHFISNVYIVHSFQH